MSKIEVHPVQIPSAVMVKREGAWCPKTVTLAAYEVYRHLYGDQQKIVTGGCRGGFSSGELIAYLYAKSFPQSEWRDRVKEALDGMKNL